MKNLNKIIAAPSASEAGNLPDSPIPAPVNPAAHADSPTAHPPPPFPIVGIGASAGGLDAFTQLLKALPNDTGMAFVLIQHLSPEHESALTEILARATAMPVTEIIDGTPVQPNHVYVIPPNTDLTLDKGILKLTLRSGTRAPTRPIDHFLKSLAEDRGDCGIGIILSGTASDGTLGLQAIKEAGGITFAQDESAQYDGMPRSAVASGAVDLVLAPAGIARELGRISLTPYLTLAEAVRPSAPSPGAPPGSGERPLKQVLALLQNKTKVDFTLYKPGTIQRRVTRRMVLNKLETLADYVQLLRENPAEILSLYQDLLINVTSFFRDPDAFEVLKQTVFPKLLKERTQDNPVRMWVAGCATGQEVYSLVMSYLEAAGDSNIPFKVFATDINEMALEQARAGIYNKSLVQEVSIPRLRRFFVEVQGGYQINKAIRESCVFARHNVVNDPPFSRLDLISCRNLLIYLEPELQKKVLPIFHYGLKPEGFLLLGASESIGSFEELFATQDKQHKLYSRKSGVGRAPLAIPVHHEMKRGTSIPDRPVLTAPKFDPEKEADRMCLARFVPAGVLVNADLEILQFRGDTSAYLMPASGKPSHNLLKMARDGLMLPLREAVEKAIREHVPVSREGVRVEQENGFLVVNLEVMPVRNLSASESCFLVFFYPVKKATRVSKRAATAKKDSSAAPRLAAESEEVARLKQEQAEMKDYLQSVTERQDATNEELQAAGEEMQSSNEELQSINEELETSKEELQATNEELTTVNEELSNRNRENSRLNDDLNNFVNSAAIPMVMVVGDFRLRRFTPSAEKLLNLNGNDLGRSLHEIKLGFDLPELERLIEEAIETVSPREREVQDRQGRWHLLRVRPYITLDRKIEGTVLAFLDIDALKRSELLTKGARDYAESILRTTPTPFLVLNADLRVHTANRAFYDAFQTSPAEAEGRLIYELGNGQWNIPKLRELLEKVLPENTAVNDYEVTHVFELIGRCTMLLNARRMGDPGGQPSRILVGIQDITARKQSEDALRVANDEMEQFSYTITHDMRAPLRAMVSYGDILLSENEGIKPESRTFLERIVSAAERMDQLIVDALNYSKLVRQEIELVPVDCGALLRSMIGSYPQFELSKKTILIEGTMPVVLGNEAALTQCFSNLLNNAIKFVKPGQPPEIRIWAQDQGARVRIWVEDKGIGIPPPSQERIFVMFQRISSDNEGTGIGLALVKKAAERMAGSVGVESALGEGSRFWIELKKAST